MIMPSAEQILIRPLKEADIPAALLLKELALWNQTEQDWWRLLRLEPRGCFCAKIADRLVATITTTTYGSELGWIGMVLVDPAHRRRGIATRLMHTAMEYLRECGLLGFKLDATPAGLPVYESLGFKMELLVERWVGVAGDIPDPGCAPLDLSAHRSLFMLDRRAFGANRSRLIELLIEDACVTPLVATANDGEVVGYALARRGSNAAYIGPIVAGDEEQVVRLLDGSLRQLAGQQVYVDINTGFPNASSVLAGRGFAKQRDLMRMSYGKRNAAGTSPLVFAIAGPEVG